MYQHLQEEQLDLLKDDLVSCIHGEEGKGGDDQDLDDRVIRHLWDENKELREEVNQLRKDTGDDADEAMAAILRDRINDLLTANADLEREVARLRYADAARGAAESVETLDKLRKTRDTLNDIVTENDQLKIEVAKARYGEPPAQEQEVKQHLELENQQLREQLERLSVSGPVQLYDTFETAIKFLGELDLQKSLFTNTRTVDDLQKPWASKRHEELKTDDNDGEDKNTKDKEETMNKKNKNGDDEDEIKNQSMENLSKYLATLVGNFGNKIISKSGVIDWSLAKK